MNKELIALRVKEVNAVAEHICGIARLSPYGKHGIDFFDSITKLWNAAYARAIEDAAQSLETLSKGDMPTDRQIGLRMGADVIRKLKP